MDNRVNLDDAIARVRGVLADAREAIQSDTQSGIVWRSDVRDECLAIAILALAERIESLAFTRLNDA